MTDRIEKPLQVAQNPGLVALHRNDSLVPTLLSFSRFLVRETIEQAGLKSVEQGVSFGHIQQT
jgi:hypothetical protein